MITWKTARRLLLVVAGISLAIAFYLPDDAIGSPRSIALGVAAGSGAAAGVIAEWET